MRQISELLTKQEVQMITTIQLMTRKYNQDNITRTNAYLNYYLQYPEITWAFLANMVSRNGGWNMCDLEGDWLPRVIPQKLRQLLFMTYEKANWLIFQDAFPQLQIYHYSTKLNCPLFHLLPYFHVSFFMTREWDIFWKSRNSHRLMSSLIINEQNVIQKPVIAHPFYQKKVFRSYYFLFQDWFHFNSVLFPMMSGELFGASVNGFRRVDKRINLGKRLADILFKPKLYPHFLKFARQTEHTGSRYDYEQYLLVKKRPDTPYLRNTYPVISHERHEFHDWSATHKIKQAWFSKVEHKQSIQLTHWYQKKQSQLHFFIKMANFLK